MKLVRVAVLGAGFMGGTHARAYHKLDGVEIAAICANTSKRAQPLAEELDTRWTSDLSSIIEDSSIDAVDISLPTPDHRAVTEAAIAEGKHVLLEKPLAISMEDAVAIAAAADGSENIVMMAHVLRFWPEYVALKQMIDSGELGRPVFVSAVRRQPAPNWTDGGPRGHLTGGSIHDMLIHDFDAANWVLGSPQGAFATGVFNEQNQAVDQAQVLVTYDGASATIDGGSTMPESYPFTARFEVLCEHGAIEYHFQAGGRSFEVGEPTNTLTVYRHGGDPEVIEVEQSDPYENEIAYFVKCVRNGTAAERATPAQGLEAMKVSLAAQRALKSATFASIQTA